jgi:hypothetical protein
MPEKITAYLLGQLSVANQRSAHISSDRHAPRSKRSPRTHLSYQATFPKAAAAPHAFMRTEELKFTSWYRSLLFVGPRLIPRLGAPRMDGDPGAIQRRGSANASQRAPPADEVKQNHDDRDHQKYVDKATHRVGSDQSKQPQYEQNNRNRIEHEMHLSLLPGLLADLTSSARWKCHRSGPISTANQMCNAYAPIRLETW